MKTESFLTSFRHELNVNGKNLQYPYVHTIFKIIMAVMDTKILLILIAPILLVPLIPNSNAETANLQDTDITRLVLLGPEFPVFGEDAIYEISIFGEVLDRGYIQVYVYLADDKSKTNFYEYTATVTQGSPHTTIEIPIRHPIFAIDQNYVLEAKNGDAITQLQIIPKRQQTGVSEEGDVVITEREEPSVRLFGFIERAMENRWLAVLELCAGKDRLTTPTIRVTTDMDDTEIKLEKIINSGSCGSVNGFDVVAKEPSSVKVEYVGLQQKLGASTDDITELKMEIETLKQELVKKDETIEKKDAVIMEQIKVIKDLANMITNAVFEPISKFFGFA